MAQFYSALTIVSHLYTTASLRIGTDSPRCTCHFSFFLISYKCLILKNRKKRRNTVSQIAMCPDLQAAKGQGREVASTQEKSYWAGSRECWGELQSQQTPPANPWGRRTRKKTNSQKRRAASSWTWPRQGGNVLRSFCQLTSPGGRRGGGKSMRKGWEGG